MTDIAIRVDNLSKLYHIGRAQQRHDTLRDALVSVLKRSNVGASEHPEDLWALKDVSFEVRRGEAIGIIGRNGAGKSTLLKVLSRITEPTAGRVILEGRVASLLEVGTGFHPELTGRENIYLNGAILGMRRAEIERKFDEIVAFAEIERFLDTPVKRYSSGMYVRLAFAVAAHMEPEILLVDEVLAVGDAAFQKKCLGKMGTVAKEGRTVLFVSHNMTAVQSLCETSVLLGGGTIAALGATEDVIAAYLAVGTRAGAVQFDIATPRQGTGTAQYIGARVLSDAGKPICSVPMGGSLILELWFSIARPVAHPAMSARLHTALGQDIAAWRTQETYGQMPPAATGGSVRLHIHDLNLLPGIYHFAIGLTDGYQTLDLIEDALSVEVAPRALYSSDSVTSFRRGELIYTPCEWRPQYE